MNTRFYCLSLLAMLFAVSVTLNAQDKPKHTQQTSAKNKQAIIASATSAAPASITKNATIMDWPKTEGGEMVLIRKGTNDYTCLPDMPASPGTDPMCLDEPWLTAIDAWMNKKEVKIDRIGFGYMLQGGAPESNTDPYATGPTSDNEWMDRGIPHLMIVVPDTAALKGLPVTAEKGGPWVMWRDTPYAHIMAPMPKYESPRNLSNLREHKMKNHKKR